MKVIRERILNAVHKCLQWENGEIAGIDMLKLEQRVDGILEQLNKPVVMQAEGSERPTRFTIEEVNSAIKELWIKDFRTLDNSDTEYRDGYFVCGFVNEALKAAKESGATVGQRSGGTSVSAGCVHNFLHYIGPWYTCDDCGAHFNARAEAPSEGACDF